MTTEQKKEENFWTRDHFEKPTAKVRDWVDNKFQGDKRTLEQIRIDRQNIRDEAQERRETFHDEQKK